MAILGLTHDATGARRKRLPVTIKIAIGEIVIHSGKPRPVRLDHFVFKRKVQKGDKVSWASAPDIAALFEKNPKEIGIIFTSDNLDEVFPSEPVFRTAYGWRCRGALVEIKNEAGFRFEMQATRRTEEHPDGEPWPGQQVYQNGPLKGQPLPKCGQQCPEFRAKKCKYSAYLYFRLEKLPLYGAICRIHTTSPKSIGYVSNGLAEIHEQNAGRLNGVHATLRLSPESTWYPDNEGERHPTVIHVLSLEAGAPSGQPEQGDPNGTSSLMHAARAPEDFEPCLAIESEEDLAAEIADEFYPENFDQSDKGSSEEPATNRQGARQLAQSAADNDQNARIDELFARLRYKPAQAQMLLGQYAGKLGALEQRLRNALGDGNAPQKDTTIPRQDVDSSTQAAAQPNGHKNGSGQLPLYSSQPTHNH